ncbi:MAG: hypothetical protein HRT88_23075, partial [Lentisphaeraceae bacterium]|nr:hypothetical protein [Lentisphaeraceae bacterium]
MSKTELSENSTDKLDKNSLKLMWRLWSVLMPYKGFLIFSNIFCALYVLTDILLVDSIAELAGRGDINQASFFELIQWLLLYAVLNRL